MVSQKQKMKGLQEFAKSLRKGEGGAAIAKLLYYSSNPTPVDVSKKNISTKPKENKKVDLKMLQAKRKGKKYSILNTAMGLTDSIKTTKKTLLG